MASDIQPQAYIDQRLLQAKGSGRDCRLPFSAGIIAEQRETPYLNRKNKAIKQENSKKSTCIAGGFEQPPRRGLKESPIQTKLDLTD
ncbi:hypothetical protein [Shewanella algae]|uniref:hypothetical protein n=1 Tax=Shewanella algae TaxID=38313 RepID=UPI0031F5CB69